MTLDRLGPMLGLDFSRQGLYQLTALVTQCKAPTSATGCSGKSRINDVLEEVHENQPDWAELKAPVDTSDSQSRTPVSRFGKALATLWPKIFALM